MSEKEQSSVLIGLLLPYLQRANNPQVYSLLGKGAAYLHSQIQCNCFYVTISGDRNRHPGHGAEPAATVRAAIGLPAAAQQTVLFYPQQAAQKGPHQCLSGTEENETMLRFIGLIMNKVWVISPGSLMCLISNMFYILDWNFTILCI